MIRLGPGFVGFGAWVLAPREDGARLECEDVRTVLASRIHAIPRLRARVRPVPGLGAFWEDSPSFDLRDHVTTIGDGSDMSLDELADHCAQQAVTSFDMSRPPWRIGVVPQLDGGRSALIVSSHHVYGDAQSLVTLTAMALLGFAPDANVSAAQAWQPSSAPPVRTLFSERVRKLGAVRHSRPQFSAKAKEFLGLIPDAALNLRELRSRGPLRFGGQQQVRSVAGSFFEAPLADVVKTSRALGATVNDLVLAAAASAMRQQMLRSGIEPTHVPTLIPKAIEAENGTFNNIEWLVVGLPTSHDKPLERLRRCRAVAVAALGGMRSKAHAATEQAILNLPNGVRQHALGWWVQQAVAEAVVSNFPGPTFDLYFMDRRVEGIYPGSSVLFDHLKITLTSMHGRLIGLMIFDKEVFGDDAPFATDFTAELRRLEDSARNRVALARIPGLALLKESALDRLADEARTVSLQTGDRMDESGLPSAGGGVCVLLDGVVESADDSTACRASADSGRGHAVLLTEWSATRARTACTLLAIDEKTWLETVGADRVAKTELDGSIARQLSNAGPQEAGRR